MVKSCLDLGNIELSTNLCIPMEHIYIELITNRPQNNLRKIYVKIYEKFTEKFMEIFKFLKIYVKSTENLRKIYGKFTENLRNFFLSTNRARIEHELTPISG